MQNATHSIDPAGSVRPGAAIAERQKQLHQRYQADPKAAWTSDYAQTRSDGIGTRDPEHSIVELGRGHGAILPIGVHHAIGGQHDQPVPGDVLCAALACCADSTLRLVANRLGIELEELDVRVVGELDVRGTLCVSFDVPVGFQKMALDVHLRPVSGTSDKKLAKLRMLTEYCCVVLRTLRDGVPIDVSFSVGHEEEGGQS